MIEEMIEELRELFSTQDDEAPVRLSFMKNETWVHIPTSGHEEYIVKYADKDGYPVLCTEFTKDEIDIYAISDILDAMRIIARFKGSEDINV